MQELGQSEELRQMDKLLSTAQNAADAANHAINIQRIQPELRLLGVPGHIRCIYQGTLTLLSVVGVGAAVSKTVRVKRYYYFNNGMVVREDDESVPAVNLVRYEFERVEEVGGAVDTTFKIFYKGGVVDIVQGANRRDKDRWLKQLHMTGVRELLKGGEEAIGEFWEKYDTNHDGFIGQDEFRQALRTEFPDSNDGIADTIFRNFDQNGNGKLTKDELKNALVVPVGLRRLEPVLFPSLAHNCSWKICFCFMMLVGMATTLFFNFLFPSQVAVGNARGGGAGGAGGLGEL